MLTGEHRHGILVDFPLINTHTGFLRNLWYTSRNARQVVKLRDKSVIWYSGAMEYWPGKQSFWSFYCVNKSVQENTGTLLWNTSWRLRPQAFLLHRAVKPATAEPDNKTTEIHQRTWSSARSIQPSFWHNYPTYACRRRSWCSRQSPCSIFGRSLVRITVHWPTILTGFSTGRYNRQIWLKFS